MIGRNEKTLSSRVQEITAEILQVNDVSIENNLKDQGLDSLRLLFLIDELEREFEIKLVGEELRVEDFRSIISITSLLKNNYGKSDH